VINLTAAAPAVKVPGVFFPRNRIHAHQHYILLVRRRALAFFCYCKNSLSNIRVQVQKSREYPQKFNNNKKSRKRKINKKYLSVIFTTIFLNQIIEQLVDTLTLNLNKLTLDQNIAFQRLRLETVRRFGQRSIGLLILISRSFDFMYAYRLIYPRCS
jgi:hypothetical protein